MDILGWLFWLAAKLLAIVWTVGWFLLGGWVVTLAQVAVIGGLIYAYKYGWRRAPIEITRQARTFGGFVWAWARSREMPARAPRDQMREVVRTVRRKEFGDVNLSTLLSVLAVAGLGVVSLT